MLEVIKFKSIKEQFGDLYRVAYNARENTLTRSTPRLSNGIISLVDKKLRSIK